MRVYFLSKYKCIRIHIELTIQACDSALLYAKAPP
jgi:hypothetical protein